MDGMALSTAQLQVYLSRLGCCSSELPPPTLETLARLQHAHLQKIPFENCCMVLEAAKTPVFGAEAGAAVDINPQAAFQKMVGGMRGGYCFEVS